MIREEKLVSIAVLTVLLYALGIFFESSFFLIPFPLFDLIFFAVFIQFLIWNKNTLEAYIWVYLAAVLLQVIYNPLFLGTVASDIELRKLDEFLLIDGLKLLGKLLLIISVFLWRHQRKLKFSIFYIFLFILILGLGLTEQFFWITPLAATLIAFHFWKTDRNNSFRYLWILQGIFDLFTVIMLVYS